VARRPSGESHFWSQSIDSLAEDVLKVLLKVKPEMGEGYSWVTCGACEHEWAVPDYAEERVG
jgi:hypothetical protein